MESSVEILYVCHRFPYPPKRGGKIRPFNMIRHLAERHRVTVASLVRSDAEAAEGKGLEKHCEEVLIGRVSEPWQTLRMIARLPTPVPSSMGYFYSRRLRSAISEAFARKKFDLLFVHCSSVAQYVSDFRGVPKILDFGDMDSQKWLTYAEERSFPLTLGYLLEGRKLEAEERRLAEKFDLCTCTTKQELQTLRSYGSRTQTDWFPNGVDADYFSPDGSEYDRDLISFVGRMDYYPNQQCMIRFCRDILPLIQRKRPTAKLVIVGANPSSEIRRLGDLPGVKVTGSVSDVRPYVRGSAVMVAPLAIARGTQNKILEAMAMGVPTVTSELAANGVDAVPGDHLLTSSTDSGYSEAVLRLLDDPVERRRFASQGRERMLSHHDWTKSMSRMERILEGCVERFHYQGKAS